MRLASRGNLTVQLIQMQRFDPGFAPAQDPIRKCLEHRAPAEHEPRPWCRTDKVELTQQACPSDPWASKPGPVCPIATTTIEPEPEPIPAPEAEAEPRAITPVKGSVALSGLGVSLIVPGTLLDVVA